MSCRHRVWRPWGAVLRASVSGALWSQEGHDGPTPAHPGLLARRERQRPGRPGRWRPGAQDPPSLDGQGLAAGAGYLHHGPVCLGGVAGVADGHVVPLGGQPQRGLRAPPLVAFPAAWTFIGRQYLVDMREATSRHGPRASSYGVCTSSSPMYCVPLPPLPATSHTRPTAPAGAVRSD